MNVAELIDVLLDFDPEAPVRLRNELSTGFSVRAINEIWTTEGVVVIE